jgi:uncharacterized protein YbjQ (UPF0145 family)
MMVSTTNEIFGFKTVRHLGVVRGITVRSRSVAGNFVGGLQSMFGGQISAYVELAETAREAFGHLCKEAPMPSLACAMTRMTLWTALPKFLPMAVPCG